MLFTVFAGYLVELFALYEEALVLTNNQKAHPIELGRDDLRLTEKHVSQILINKHKCKKVFLAFVNIFVKDTVDCYFENMLSYEFSSFFDGIKNVKGSYNENFALTGFLAGTLGLFLNPYKGNQSEYNCITLYLRPFADWIVLHAKEDIEQLNLERKKVTCEKNMEFIVNFMHVFLDKEKVLGEKMQKRLEFLSQKYIYLQFDVNRQLQELRGFLQQIETENNELQRHENEMLLNLLWKDVMSGKDKITFFVDFIATNMESNLNLDAQANVYKKLYDLMTADEQQQFLSKIATKDFVQYETTVMYFIKRSKGIIGILYDLIPLYVSNRDNVNKYLHEAFENLNIKHRAGLLQKMLFIAERNQSIVLEILPIFVSQMSNEEINSEDVQNVFSSVTNPNSFTSAFIEIAKAGHAKNINSTLDEQKSSPNTENGKNSYSAILDKESQANPILKSQEQGEAKPETGTVVHSFLENNSLDEMTEQFREVERTSRQG